MAKAPSGTSGVDQAFGRPTSEKVLMISYTAGEELTFTWL
jgi:hypothetical protein